MKTNKDAENWLKASNLPFWEIKKGERNVGRNPEPAEGKTLDLEVSASKFLEIASFLPQGAYTLYAWRFQNGKQSGLEFDFFIGSAESPQAIGNVPNPELEILRRELQDMKQKQFEKELEEKYRRKYAKENTQDGMTKFANVIGQVLQVWNSGKKPAQKTPHVGTAEESEATANQIENALTTLQEKLGTEVLANALTKLAEMPESQIQNFLKFL